MRVHIGNGKPIGDGGNDAPPRDEAIANMHLIAAAPDLLAALKALHLQALQSDMNNPADEWGYEAIQLATAAIAKATQA